MSSIPSLGAALDASIRLPVTFANTTATLLIAEVAMRVIGKGLSYVPSTVKGKIPSISGRLPICTLTLMRPFEGLTKTQLGVFILGCTVITALGWEVHRYVARGTTKSTLFKYIGPAHLDPDWRHPVIATLLNGWSGKKTST